MLSGFLKLVQYLHPLNSKRALCPQNGAAPQEAACVGQSHRDISGESVKFELFVDESLLQYASLYVLGKNKKQNHLLSPLTKWMFFSSYKTFPSYKALQK